MTTDHEKALQTFHSKLLDSGHIMHVTVKYITGLPFYYLQPEAHVSKQQLEEQIKIAAAKAMKGKRLTLTMSYVRKSQAGYVYRVRFLVPQRKMFCCGNLCDDCIRFTNP
ncbi:hypothetical protein MUN89_14570 [Halobacillus salinarum]|uniref:Uncharacterized protein n=1 Tax=Halobacillus salinarum TaxID=2932257 RepID=A0ABY4EFB4_9BACI|nr:hypothetical protein [Halobacillus salinarum]UOQ43155.1 hypothetical protein MUN89_14570 [Halobacillus salinarum]